jgi:hemolysin type calcium-binding protein
MCCPDKIAALVDSTPILRQQETTMATFNGRFHFSTITHRVIGFADTMNGTAGDDTFNAGGGNDHVWAGMGHDTVNGGSGNDTIYASAQGATFLDAHWGGDSVYGGSGDDIIDYSMNKDASIIYGDDINNSETGSDHIYGGYSGDRVYGGNGDDHIWGNAGDDVLYGDNFTGSGNGNDYVNGGDGEDTIYGGAGSDTIVGGKDFDDLYGGSGADTFVFRLGDSGKDYAHADVINDFNASTNTVGVWDKLDLDYRGSAENFGHIKGIIDTSHDTTFKQDYDKALAFAENVMHTQTNLKFEFVTDGENGWLFANVDGHAGIDYGIELKGVTDLHWQNLV